MSSQVVNISGADKTRVNGISPSRVEDYPEWYQQVVKAADLAENSSVRGCMVIKPWGYGIWELLQAELDARIKATGHLNAYFPLLIPVSFLEKEAQHVEGFAKECAVVTHHRLEERDGKLVPSGQLEEPMVIRPTSETIIGESFSKWVQSYRDLPVLINQWANVFRWEMRTRLFLRTAEFLWQEGHTAHATEAEAQVEVSTMLGVYKELIETVLAQPVIQGEKTAGERFPGAVQTFCVEAMMQDRKALQAGTSHYLGQNFAKSSNIQFLNRQGEHEFAYTTSWGVSTRLIGGLIMTHADDDGMRVPPKLAPYQVVILPVVPNEASADAVMVYAAELAKRLEQQQYCGKPVRVHIDKRDLRGGEKSWQWIKRGVPVRIEVGPRDISDSAAMVMRRDRDLKDKQKLALDELEATIASILGRIQESMYEQARSHLDSNTVTDIKTFSELEEFFTPKNIEKPEIHGGFVRAKFCDRKEAEERLAKLKLTVRCLPLDQTGTEGRCVVTGEPASVDAIIAKSY